MSHSILVFPVHPTSLAKLIKLARFLRTKNVECTFLVATKSVFDRRQDIKDAGFSSIELALTHPLKLTRKITNLVWVLTNIFCQHEDLEFCKPTRSNLSGYLRYLKQKLYYLRIQQEYKTDLRNKKTEIKHLVDNTAFERIIISGDRSLGYEAALLAYIDQKKIPCIIPPISISNDPIGLANDRLNKDEIFDISNNQYVRKKWPEQCFNLQSTSVSFYEFWRLKILDELNILPPCPWILGGGRSNKFLIGNGLDAARYISNGLKQDDVTVVGDSEFDELYSAYQHKTRTRSNLIEKYHLKPELPIILIGMPQLFEHNLLSYDKHMDVITTICEGAQQSKVNVLASLHPKMDKNNYLFLQSKYNFAVLTESLSNCLPVADIYVSCQGSSTWVWSVLCEVPMIVCDWYGSNANISKTEYGVSIINDANNYSIELHKLLTDLTYYEHKKRQCIDVKPQIMQFDGGSNERIYDQIFD